MRSTEPAPKPSALPREVVALARRCGATAAGSQAEHVTLTQTGTMRPDEGPAWMAFRARQTISTDRCEFVWRATTGPMGCVAVVDALEVTGPRLSVTAFGFIPLVRAAADAALTKGELQRYLADLPLAPDAILRNPALRWEVLGHKSLRVSATHGGTIAHVDLELGADGMVKTASAPDRPRLEGKITVQRDWLGRFGEYRSHLGRRIPFASDVGWLVDSENGSYCRGAITEWMIGDKP